MDTEPGLTGRYAADEVRPFNMKTIPFPSGDGGRILAVSLAASIVFLAGCDKNQISTLDTKNSAPQVTRLEFAPGSVYLDSLTPSNGTYSIATTVKAQASDGDGQGDLAAVSADVLMADGTLAVSSVPLHDDGLAPDSAQGDGIFSGTLQLQLTRAQAGRWQIRASAVDREGAVSNSLSKELAITRHDAVPQVFDLTAPDTLTIAPGDSSLLRMSIAASDSDGLADIVEVYWQSPDGQNPDFHFPLKDDGGLSPGPPSGDPVAGDGIFSYRQWIHDSPTVRGTYRLIFKARDTADSTSAPLLHNLIIR